jgi:hypothetical protein
VVDLVAELERAPATVGKVVRAELDLVVVAELVELLEEEVVPVGPD